MTKEPVDLVSVEKASLWRRDAFDRNRSHLLGDGQAFWNTSGQEFEEGVQDRPSVISGPTVIVPRLFKMLKESHGAVAGQGVDGDLRQPTGDVGGHEHEEEAQRVTVRPHRSRPQASLERELVDEKRVQEGAK
jgi:hypothetical protein